MVWLSIAIGLVPSFVWLAFYLREDQHPESARAISKTFFLGAGVTFVVFAVQAIWNLLLTKLSLPLQGTASLIFLAASEEFFKFLAAYFAIHKSKEFDEPIDAMIYVIVAALGFAAVENIGTLYSVTLHITPEVSLVDRIIQATTFRFVGATLLHTLTSGIVGYYWARGILTKRVWHSVALGLFAATLLHALFNYFILKVDELIIATFYLVIVAFFVLHDFETLKVASSETNSV